MTPIDQTIMHDPVNGLFGDCMRACIASLLDLPIAEVPHFFEGGCKAPEFDRRVAEFLGKHDLVEFSMAAETAGNMHFIRDCYHLMYGHTVRGTYHAVVALNGIVVHDPHPSKDGIIEDHRVRHAYLIRSSTSKEAA